MIKRPPFRGLLVLVALLGLWQLLGDPTSPYYPPPSTWWTAIQLMNAQGVLLPALGATVRAMVIALLLVVLVGGTLGALLGSSTRLARLLGPTIEVCRTMPPAVLVPLVIVVFGASPVSLIGLTTFTAMWAVVLNTAAATRAIPQTRIDAAHSLGLSRTATIGKVLIPSLVPGISLGLRVAAPVILIVVILTEMLTALPGMGRLLTQAQQGYAVTRMFGVLALVGLVGYLLNLLVAFLQERLGGAWSTGQ